MRMDLSGWYAEIRILILLVLVTLAGALWLQSYLLFFAIGLVVAFCWYLYQIWNLSRKLAVGAEITVPAGSGLLAGLAGHASALQQRAQEQERYNSQVVSLFRQAFETFPDAVLLLRPDWRIRWCNRVGREMFGLSQENNISGSLVDKVRHPVLAEYLAAGNFSKPLELEAPADRSKIISIQLTALPGDDGALLLVARDITRLYLLDRMRSDFVANVSHELKTPLTVLAGFLESMHLDGEDIPEHWSHAVELMYQQSERMRGIVDDLLLLSRLDADQDGFAPELVDVPELLQRAITDARAVAQESGHNIILESDASLKLQGEQKTLESLFYNLIMNAVHHTPAGTRVDVRWFEEEGRPVLKVSDSGDGIPARHLPHLTEPFYRVDAGRSRETGGTGLGLSIVNRAVSRHKGRLQITSEVGKGTLVKIEFPKELGGKGEAES